MRLALVLCVVLSSPLALGEPSPASRAKELAAEGNRAAAAGELTTARERFREALRLDRRVAYMCNLGMTHYGLDDLVRAQPFLDRCTKGHSVPNPEILNVLSYVTDTLAKDARYILIEIETSPSSAWVEVDALGDDPALLAPLTLYVPVGQRRIRVSAKDYASKSVEITTKAGGENRIKIDLEPSTPDNKAVPSVPATRNANLASTTKDTADSTPLLSWLTLGGGAALAVTGGVFHYLSFHSRDAARAAAERSVYDGHVDDLEQRRVVAISLYGAGAALAALGTYLLLRSDESEGQLAILPSQGGLWASARIDF